MKVYRSKPIILLFGIIFLAVGLFLGGAMVSQIVAKKPMMVASDDSGANGHVASSIETTAFLLLPIGALLVGGMLALSWKNCRVFTTDDEIRVTNLIGRDSFRSSWAGLTKIDRKVQGEAYYFRLSAGDRKVNIPGLLSTDALLEDIFSHASQLRS